MYVLLVETELLLLFGQLTISRHARERTQNSGYLKERQEKIKDGEKRKKKKRTQNDMPRQLTKKPRDSSSKEHVNRSAFLR